jgi:hypothetical protein
MNFIFVRVEILISVTIKFCDILEEAQCTFTRLYGITSQKIVLLNFVFVWKVS